MKYNNYLKFFDYLNKTDQIEEKFQIIKLNNGKEIKENNLTKKKCNVKKVIKEFKLSNGHILLIDDIIENFFLFYSIIIGEKTKLFSFKLKSREGEFISNEQIIEEIKDLVLEETIKPYSVLNLRKVSYEINYNIPKILLDIKKFTKDKKGTDLDEVHITKDSDLELFLPTIKEGHLDLAKKIQIPVRSMIKNNYIIEDSMNIFDHQTQEEILKPLKTYNKRVEWDLVRDSLNKVYKDIQINYSIILRDNQIEKRIHQIDHINTYHKDLISDAKKIKKIKISTSKGNIPIPLWKSFNKQSFIEIEDEIQFEELTGRKFSLEPSRLNDILIQTIDGEDGIYKNLFLKEWVEKVIENTEKEKENITFKTIEELIIKLYYNHNIKRVIEVKESAHSNIQKLKKLIHKLIENIIKLSIYYNKKPYKNNFEDQFTKYLKYQRFIMFNDIKNYLEDKITRKDFINSIDVIMQNDNKLINSKFFNKNHFYEIYQNLLLAIEIYEIFDQRKSKILKNRIKEYFPKIKLNSIESRKLDKDYVEIYDIIINQYEKELFIFHKDQEESLENLNKIMKKIPSKESKGEVYKINRRKIIQTFPYSNKEIINNIEKNWDNKIPYNIKLKNGKNIKINSDFFLKHYEFKNYKTIFDNQFIQILIHK